MDLVCRVIGEYLGLPYGLHGSLTYLLSPRDPPSSLRGTVLGVGFRLHQAGGRPEGERPMQRNTRILARRVWGLGLRA